MANEQYKADAYERVTARIIDALEAGVRPWQQPWAASSGFYGRPLRHNGKGYHGINVPLLWGAAQEKGYQQAYGGQVRKGERSEQIVFFKPMEKLAPDPITGELRKLRFGLARMFSVFNAEQCDGLPERFAGVKHEIKDPIAHVTGVRDYFAAIGAKVQSGGSRAYYSEPLDYIGIPDLQAFRSPADYYATLGHEHVHWTKHETRLARDFGRKAWGDEAYAREELVAELGAAFLMADLGLSAEPREDHAQYLASWLKALKEDKRAIFQASSFAEKAVTFLHKAAGRHVDGEDEEEPERGPEPVQTGDVVHSDAA